VAAAPVLSAVSQAAVPVPGSPFSVVATPDGRWSFVTLNSAVEVLSNRSLAPGADRQVSVPGTPQGEQLTNDGRYLLVADGSGAVVIDVARAEDGAAGAVLGTLSSPAGQGAVEVVVSPDDRFAFVTLELSHSLAVFDLHKALASGFGPADFVGTVTVIGLRQAEIRPSDAVAGTVPAGCSPVRVVTSADGKVVWVTARGSDAVLAFSAAALRTDPRHALLARVQVGEAPVGLALSGDGRRPALLGLIPAGAFPREMTVIPRTDTLLVTDYLAEQVQAVNLATAP
jgi:DNA-binding beta-propeller fold protein YncE